MPTRTSNAVWNGALTTGSGTMSTGSGAFTGAYSFPTRFDNGQGTNPEELIAAAHAGCYSMALSHLLAEAGHVPTSVKTEAAVHLNQVGDGFAITRIDLTTRGQVPGIDQETFIGFAEQAKVGCPVSKALAAVTMTLDAKLVD